MYQIDFEVKYKAIELEIKSKEDWLQKDSDYKEDFDVLLDELFKHELSHVLEIEDVDTFNLEHVMTIFQNMKRYAPFLALFRPYQTTYFPFGFTDENVFLSLFQYETFYALHPCICEFLESGQISEDKLQKLKDACIFL